MKTLTPSILDGVLLLLLPTAVTVFAQTDLPSETSAQCRCALCRILDFRNGPADYAELIIGTADDAEPARPGLAPDLDKNPGFHYIFRHEIPLQHDLVGGVPQTQEKLLPIPPISSVC